jgi:hypothetical protein
MRFRIFLILASILLVPTSRAYAADDIPMFKITPVESSITFDVDVEASVDIKGKFDKWDASLTFTSSDVSTAVLDIKIQADSVDTKAIVPLMAPAPVPAPSTLRVSFSALDTPRIVKSPSTSKVRAKRATMSSPFPTILTPVTA